MTCDDTDMGNELSAHAQWANHAEALYAAKGRDPVAIAGLWINGWDNHPTSWMLGAVQVASSPIGPAILTGSDLIMILVWCRWPPNGKRHACDSRSQTSPPHQRGLFTRFWPFLPRFNMSLMTNNDASHWWPHNLGWPLEEPSRLNLDRIPTRSAHQKQCGPAGGVQMANGGCVEPWQRRLRGHFRSNLHSTAEDLPARSSCKTPISFNQFPVTGGWPSSLMHHGRWILIKFQGEDPF